MSTNRPSGAGSQLDSFSLPGDTLLGVYTGSSQATPSLVASNDDAPGLTTSVVTINVVAGATCQIAVDGYNGASGNINLGLRYA